MLSMCASDAAKKKHFQTKKSITCGSKPMNGMWIQPPLPTNKQSSLTLTIYLFNPDIALCMCIVAYCALVCITQFESSQLLRLSSIRYTPLSCECISWEKKNCFSHMPTLDICLYWLRVRCECVYSVFVKPSFCVLSVGIPEKRKILFVQIISPNAFKALRDIKKGCMTAEQLSTYI